MITRKPNREYLAYRSWESMKRRCDSPVYKGYASYGGRGITYHPDWADFLCFLRDVGERPSPKHSLDRINNDGNYEPGNVRWATPEEQGRNTRTFNNYCNVYHTSDRKKWVADIGRHSGMKRITKRFNTKTEADQFVEEFNRGNYNG